MSVATSVRPARRAILYDRVSTALQSKAGYSGGVAGFQIDQCRTHAERRGYAVVGTLTDVDSGAEWNTDGIMEALDRASRHEYDVLVVSDTSRFARNLAKKTVYEADLRRSGVAVEYLNLPEVEGPEGRFMSNVFGALDELERERIAHRTKQGKRQKAKNGKVVGTGRAPYGYAYLTEWSETKHRDVPVGLVPHPSEAPIVQRIYREIAFCSTIEIAKLLTAEGTPTPTGRGKRWQASSVRAILVRTVYRGTWVFAGIPVPVTPLVDDRTWETAQARLAERAVARRGRRPDDDPYELRGLLTCGHCEGVISTDRNTTGKVEQRRTSHRVYRCLRHQPGRAQRAGWKVCALGSFKAANDALPDERWHEGDGIEQRAWRIVVAELLDAERLDANLRALAAQHADVHTERGRRLAVLDAQIAEHERLMKRAGDEKLKLEPDDPRYTMYDEREGQESRLVRRYRDERAQFAALPVPGLDAHHAAQLREAADALRAGLADASSADRRWYFQTLQLRGRVFVDYERGQRVGYRAWLRIEWSAVIPLNSKQDCLVICMPRKSR